jgi:hypothetical protein
MRNILLEVDADRHGRKRDQHLKEMPCHCGALSSLKWLEKDQNNGQEECHTDDPAYQESHFDVVAHANVVPCEPTAAIDRPALIFSCLMAAASA